ncbi:YczE/YyaS/YitT family protein [Clostridium saccharoperbutylacetonicum]|uniref:YczE/YyaS/YitT family protein n=1 Tax=Clostridium saccharoperbutylacetonicum TaxID=36745 RepID=UPI0039E86DE8
MKVISSLVIRITIGFFLCACGTVLALNSNLGLSPWDVFHQGLTKISSVTMGQASIIVGVIIVIITSILGLKVGLGTIANMIVIGCFIDLIIYAKIIPVCNNLFSGIIMMIGSLFASAIGSYLYIGCEMGCGPRDGLMIALVKITGKPIGIIRFFIEMGALIIGWILGGFVGVGTLITAFGIGYCVQLIYKIFKSDVKLLKHRNIREGIKFVNECMTN